ncbi:DUF5687 family protein [Daejeonella oryzae]|uniref:DUF5687 family protein n=1 Tax=Daejeonella oryzae TaxID=1122943 RepID=UPI0003FEE2F0|nr:DUF5687 family protein [Daejeonella oryzae]
MTLTLIRQQWKAFWRSKNTGQSILIQVILGIFILYILINLLAVSFFLDKILGEIFPGKNILSSFSGLLLYYFLFDLILRYQFQELPTLRVKPYLHLPIKRSQIINYLSFISLWSGFNLAPFLLTVPFLAKIVLPQYGVSVFAGFIIAIAALTFFNHFFSLWLKRKENGNAWVMLIFLASIGGLAYIDFSLHLISISGFSDFIFSGIIKNSLLSFLLLIPFASIFLVNYFYLKKNLYLDELHSSTENQKSSSEIPFLNRFGVVGDLAATELKLIFRNKRSKSAVIKSFLFIFYGLLFYTNPRLGSQSNIFAPIFCGLLMTGIFIVNYGQFMFGWQSSHFDGLLANKISVSDFFKSKFLLFTLFATVNLILTIPYVYFGWRILIMHTAMFLWNLGVNATLVLYFANRNFKSIDLSKSASFNWQGVGASQWILSIPLFLGPFIIFLPLYWMGLESLAIAMVGIIGLGFIITRKFWVETLSSNFKNKRYQIAEGFRNK